MIDKYITLNRALRSIHFTAREIIDEHNFGGAEYTKGLNTVIWRQLSDLERLWPTNLDRQKLDSLEELIKKDEIQEYWTVVSDVIPALENAIDDYFAAQPYSDLDLAIIDLLHPRVIASSYAQFKTGQFRDAVLNSVVAIFDLIRDRTGLKKDGADLVGQAFSLSDPCLVFSTLADDSGQSDQKGFIQILQGIYLGVRNPKAHSLTISPSKDVAAQYLVFASLLCRRIEAATKIK